MKNFIDGSFRDPNGRVFVFDSSIYREIYFSYAEEYEKLMSSGLYTKLNINGQLIAHEEVSFDIDKSPEVYKIIKPEYLPFISYPYEWSFSQLKDAALLTLSIQKTALEFDMTLKDASAYNIQFQGCKPIFIDTLSFESYREGAPWVAYRQFCQHFLAPLLLCTYRDIRLSRLLQLFIDGFPLDLTCRLLPWFKRLRPGIFLHIFMHSRYEQRHAADAIINKTSKARGMNKQGFLGLIDSLESLIRGLSWTPNGTEWSDYYNEGKNNYSNVSFINKMKIVEKLIEKTNPSSVWDIGANRGIFSRIASNKGIHTVSMDFDPAAVEINYLMGKQNGENFLYPLLIDLTNPSPALGWNLKERMSLLERSPVDLVIALALIHHLVIGNNVPFVPVAQSFSGISNYLLIEFVPKEDTQVQLMLASRKDIFADYTIENFRFAFKQFYKIVEEVPLEGSSRTMFLMQVKK